MNKFQKDIKTLRSKLKVYTQDNSNLLDFENDINKRKDMLKELKQSSAPREEEKSNHFAMWEQSSFRNPHDDFSKMFTAQIRT